MLQNRELPPTDLCKHCDPAQFSFATTAELEELTEIIGQERAVSAVKFGISIRREGYNLYVLGPHSTGKFSAVRQFLEQQAIGEPTPGDWCYVNNFDQPHRPRALHLPAGRGSALVADMSAFVEELRTVIPAVFDGEDYRNRLQSIDDQFKQKHEAAFQNIQQLAKERNLALIRTPNGIAFAPLAEGKIITPEEFEKLPAEEQERIKKQIEEMQDEMDKAIYQARQLEKEQREQIRALNRDVAQTEVSHLMVDLRKKYADLPAVLDYLQTVEKDVVDNVDDFRGTTEDEATPLAGMPLPRSLRGPAFLRRYQVNLLVDHSGNHGTPVIYEDHPTYPHLVGRIEHIATQFGTLTTDFTLVKPGALHRANGGYLILEAHKILAQPFAWEQLKRALRAEKIEIESAGQMYGVINTVSLKPEPIPLDIKVVIIGDRLLYYLLSQHDPDFGELFKVAADFAADMERNTENNLLYARLIGTIARKEGLRHFDAPAVARVIERSARIVEDAERLSIRMQSVADLVREADYWAAEAGHDVVTREDMQKSIDMQIYRVSRIKERMQEQILRGTFLIDTDGAQVGQINGLSVINMGNYEFGRPTRITARVRLGRGNIIDIEREVKLGGPLHTKGVLILSGFLGARFIPDRPLSLSASLVFEQSYGEVDGDSASSAELYALLSALADVPLKQSLAVTGSVNQLGQVQAIGGVNEKIEGFFEVCAARGLTGEQGVLIPMANKPHLMLRQDVVDAVAAGKFHIYAVATVDEGIEILTGMPAGERGDDGLFPENTVNRRVEDRLLALARQMKSFNRPAKDGNKKQKKEDKTKNKE